MSSGVAPRNSGGTRQYDQITPRSGNFELLVRELLRAPGTTALPRQSCSGANRGTLGGLQPAPRSVFVRSKSRILRIPGIPAPGPTPGPSLIKNGLEFCTSIHRLYSLLTSPKLLPIVQASHMTEYRRKLVETTLILLTGRFLTLNTLLGHHLPFDRDLPDCTKHLSGPGTVADGFIGDDISEHNPCSWTVLHLQQVADLLGADALPPWTDLFEKAGSNLKKLRRKAIIQIAWLVDCGGGDRRSSSR
ncbi:hypothetical protein CF319_g8398 [Tilletia indica]|nr:hypothetical protein CF319_g8398 [Tilletia indica]